MLIPGIHHEDLTLEMMRQLNQEMEGALEMAMQMFLGTYHRPFFNQLIASQLDVDRLDYLRRDSFYTGVAEGVIGSERIIKMMVVHNDELLLEEKGIYSIEKFLIARRLMYWQVYLHKTVLGAEALLHTIFRRARHLVSEGQELFGTPGLQAILQLQNSERVTSEMLNAFVGLDDYDVMASIKVWSIHPDMVLASLCQRLLMAHPANGGQQQGKAHPHSTVVIDAGGVPKQPASKDNENHREGKSHTTKKTADGVGIECLSPCLVDVEPRDDDSRHREKHNGEGNTIAAIFFREVFLPQKAKSTSHPTSNHQPPSLQRTGSPGRLRRDNLILRHALRSARRSGALGGWRAFRTRRGSCSGHSATLPAYLAGEAERNAPTTCPQTNQVTTYPPISPDSCGITLIPLRYGHDTEIRFRTRRHGGSPG